MTDPASEPGYEGEPIERAPRDPENTLRAALLVYISVNLLLGVPLTLVPSGFLDLIGINPDTAATLGGLRVFGAMLVAWGVAAMLVIARPIGRAYFVTAGVLQLTFGAVAFVYSWAIGESLGAVWFQVVAAAILSGSAGYMWWARYRVRGLL